MSEDIINRLIELLEEKEVYLKNFLKLTKNQGQLIKNNELDDFSLILEEKSKLIARIDSLDDNFLSEVSSLKEREGLDSLEDLDSKAYPQLRELKSLTSKIDSKLKEVMELDKVNTKLLNTNLDKVKQGLKQTKNAKMAYKGYNQDPIASILLDEKK